MITNFKLFEGFPDKNNKAKIWLVPLKMPDFVISLKKIGMPDQDIKHWLSLYKNQVFTDHGKYPDRETITIKKEGGGFTWYWYPSTGGDEYTDFMGKLEYTPKEIQEYEDEIRFKQDTKKYNL
jgi:hypothetical protein